MAGYQSVAYPTRGSFGSVYSQPVQSNSEITAGWDAQAKAWDDKIAATPEMIEKPSMFEPVQLVAGGVNYSADDAKPWIDQMRGYTGNPVADQALSDAYAQYHANAGIRDIYSDPSAGSSGASHFVTPNVPAEMMTNPEYTKAVADRDAFLANRQSAEAQRAQAQIRNQQGYNLNLLGGGTVGGVLPDNYAASDYGQITGQKVGGLGGLGGVDLTGVDTAQQSGGYVPGAGSYNPNPFSYGSFKGQNPWSGF